MLRTLGDMDGALAAADVALKSQETRFQAASRKVNMLRVLKRTEDAAALVERWQKTGSRDPRLLFVRIGLAKDPEVILKDFQALSEMLPREPGFHFGLATRTMQMRKDVEASMIELDRAIEKGSRSLLPYYARCSLWVKKNDAKSALLDATTAVECNPYFNLSYELRSKVYAQLGDAQAAQRDERHAQWLLRLYDLHKKCRLNPENVEAGVALGDHYARGADWTPAVRVLSACLERDPKHANALRRRSQAYLTTGNLDAALADATALVAVSPEPGSYSVRGDVYAKRQDWDRAVQDYERAKSLDGRLEQALRKRAAWHTSKGRVEPAKADLERANQVSTAGFSTP
jgi:tetratricopeptide (TPR) repeat protein